MIAYVQGICAETDTDRIVVDVNGTGYEVIVSAATLQKAPGTGEAITLYTYMSVREDAMTLYGFLSRDELKLFRRLITVSGVGPKGGLAILSALTADELRFAILTSDYGAISRAPGIGKKTAERLVLELKDRFADDDVYPALQGDDTGTASPLGGAQEEALMALTALGYAHAEAAKAVRKAALDTTGETADAEQLLKAALKELI